MVGQSILLVFMEKKEIATTPDYVPNIVYSELKKGYRCVAIKHFTQFGVWGEKIHETAVVCLEKPSQKEIDSVKKLKEPENVFIPTNERVVFEKKKTLIEDSKKPKILFL